MRYVRIQKALECMHGVSERRGRSEPLNKLRYGLQAGAHRSFMSDDNEFSNW